MDSLKNKLEKNIEAFNSKANYFHIKKVERIKAKGVYDRFINWVTGEFDLYLKQESENLKVYFPSGWFSIRNFKNENNQNLIEIKVEGSQIACEKMMNQLYQVYNHVLRFTETKSNQCLALSC